MAEFDSDGHELRDGLRYPWPQAPDSGQVREVADGVLWLRMPLPFRLDHINLYLLRDGDAWVAVDTGMNTPQTREVWDAVLAGPCAGLPLRAVLCTHFHSDHAGVAAWLAERFRCPVLMSEAEYQALYVKVPEGDEPSWDFLDYYSRAGFSAEQAGEMYRTIQNGHFRPLHFNSYRRLREGQCLRIGTRDWQVVVGRGHSPEHACLYSAADGLLISGDQVLPRITSTVGVHATEPDADPLRDWLASIEHLRSVPDTVLVLPAHERPFRNLHARLDQLAAHHQAHLARLLEACDLPRTALELMTVLFPRLAGRFDELMALGETLAHANYLMAEGLLLREEDGALHRYRRRAALA
ncbi:MBL fold metallo-hydrolase [Pseudomonas sp. 148P]|uniref:MBL fold metallo-hydrolase n=1 Tax=Pseudomonas ulcerans TaxID=3115852 RepID=A0ABU7HNN0_9PSED|nr:MULTISPECIES: MBL fold metallo-hydrolase [unclassified Pseudomonas]MEE1923606.1 MBL fold metallo-hydrolase [Pseudomonas sp. 147P]MEE1933104.1 MBL fold metallo-hydrolase [Pseudomonas sp. 148P]